MKPAQTHRWKHRWGQRALWRLYHSSVEMGNALKISLINADPISIYDILEISDSPSTLSVRPDLYQVNLELRPVRPTIDMLETKPNPGPALEQIPSVRTRPGPRNLGRTRVGESD